MENTLHYKDTWVDRVAPSLSCARGFLNVTFARSAFTKEVKLVADSSKNKQTYEDEIGSSERSLIGRYGDFQAPMKQNK